MPINKPTISHQLKTVKSNKPKSSVIIHSIPSVAFSPQNRSHLVSSNNHQKQSNYFNRNLGNVIESSNISNTELKECTKLLRNVLSSEENKSTSTDDFNCHKQQQQLNTRSVAFKSPDLSSREDQFIYNACNQTQIIDGSDDRTDAESLTSIPDQKLTLINNNNSVNEKSVYSPSSNITYSNYCNCHSKNNNYSMHESKLNHNSSDTPRVHEKISICMRCHNIIPPTKTISKEQETVDILHNKSTDEYLINKSSPDDYPNHNIPITINSKDFKTQYQCHDVPGDKFDDFISLIHTKISELQSIARVTRDADLGRVICEIERGFQQMIRENSLLSNHLKTISKTLKWENSALKQKIKNQTETNRDMKSELKLIRQEQKQKIEELKLEVQLKSEEIRQLTERDKSNICQLKDKYNALEKEHERLRCEFQGQILQACHKDTEIIQLKHSCSQIEAKLKEEIHSLSLNNQHLKQELNSCQNQCKKYEQDLNHNQSIIKAAREQVFNLLDRHKQNRLENTNSSYRYEPSSELSMSGEWIHQASNIQQVLSMACDNKDKQSQQSADKYNNNNNMTSTPIWPLNYYSPNQQQSDQSNATNTSNHNFATTNFNNNYISSSSYNPINSDCTNPVSSYDNNIHSKKKTNVIDCDRSQSPSNVSSTLSNHSLNLSFNNNNNNHTNINNILDKRRSNVIDSRRCSESSNSDANDDPWCLPQPFNLKKMSSASSMMSTVSSLRSTDDREFRNGLQRLDTQISRLQNTLQSNLQCK